MFPKKIISFLTEAMFQNTQNYALRRKDKEV